MAYQTGPGKGGMGHPEGHAVAYNDFTMPKLIKIEPAAIEVHCVPHKARGMKHADGYSRRGQSTCEICDG